MYLFALFGAFFLIFTLTISLFTTNIHPMSDIMESNAGAQAGKQAEQPQNIRITLKDKEYRRLSEAALAQNCTPEELVERCVRQLLDA